MCGSAFGSAASLRKNLRKESFYKRHPNCKSKGGSTAPKHRVKYNASARKEHQLIYYNEHPWGKNIKIMIGIGLLLAAPFAMAFVHVTFFIFMGIFTFIVGYIAIKSLLSHVVKEKSVYRQPDPDSVQHW